MNIIKVIFYDGQLNVLDTWSIKKYDDVARRTIRNKMKEDERIKLCRVIETKLIDEWQRYQL